MYFIPPYVEQCILSLKETAAAIKGRRDLGSLPDAYMMVAEMMRSSVKVLLPENGEVYRDNEAGGRCPDADESISLAGMPAPVTCFVYKWTKKVDPYSKISCIAPKRITLVVDGKQIGEDATGEESQMFFSAFYSEQSKIWNISRISISIFHEPNFRMIDKAHVRLRRGTYGEHSWTWDGTAVDLMTGKNITRLDMDNASEEILDNFTEYRTDICAVIQCLHSLRAGASLKPRGHESRAKRKKMKRRGVGGFTYHVLELPSKAGGPSNSSGGSHATPRLHVRRAHIRRLPTGAVTFVRQCMVGDASRGFAAKDYSVGSSR